MDELFTLRVVAVASTLTAISLALLVGRFIIHWRTASPAMRWAGYLNAAAAALGLGMFGASLYLVHLLRLYQDWDYSTGDASVAREERRAIGRAQVIVFMLFWSTIFCVKFSALLLYRALFATSVTFKAAWWGVLTFNVMGAMFATFSTFIYYGPIAELYPSPTCVDPVACYQSAEHTIMAAIIVNIVSIVAVMALPLGILRSLNMKRAEKIGLAVTFGLAGLEIAFEIVTLISDDDATVFAISVMEPAIALILCPLPVYRGVLKRFSGRDIYAKVTSWITVTGSQARSERGSAKTRPGGSPESRRTVPSAYVDRISKMEAGLLPVNIIHIDSAFTVTRECEDADSLGSVHSGLSYGVACEKGQAL